MARRPLKPSADGVPLRPRRGAGEYLRALVELATGTPVPTVEEDPGWQPPPITITADLMARLTLEALATLRGKCEEGSVRAAIHLVDRGLGTVGKSFAERVREMSLDQATLELAGILRKLNFTVEQVEEFVRVAALPPGEGSE